jgi:hypothetical protein
MQLDTRQFSEGFTTILRIKSEGLPPKLEWKNVFKELCVRPGQELSCRSVIFVSVRAILLVLLPVDDRNENSNERKSQLFAHLEQNPMAPLLVPRETMGPETWQLLGKPIKSLAHDPYKSKCAGEGLEGKAEAVGKPDVHTKPYEISMAADTTV